MKLATFVLRGAPRRDRRLGRVEGDRVIELASPGLPPTMEALLAAGPSALAEVRTAKGSAVHALSAVQLAAPLERPQKFLAIGMNYVRHREEAVRAGMKVPDSQLWFNKQVSCITGPFDGVELPSISNDLDYEGELGVVIGRRCWRVGVEEAMEYVAGYLVCNDVSVRDWQRRSPTFTLGKSFPTHGPIGPWITTADEIPDPRSLALRVTVNGELRQSASVSELVYGIAEQIAYLSTAMRLEPGDILATGTPSGVGAAFEPPRFLAIGDRVRVEISELGAIENVIVAERQEKEMP